MRGSEHDLLDMVLIGWYQECCYDTHQEMLEAHTDGEHCIGNSQEQQANPMNLHEASQDR